MKLDVAKYGSSLAVLLTISNPATDAAEAATAASVKFYKVVAGVRTASGIANLTLVQQDTTPGVWGGFAALGTNEMSDLIVIARATVGGVERSAVSVLGLSSTISAQTAVSGPSITVTPGVIVDDAKNATP